MCGQVYKLLIESVVVSKIEEGWSIRGGNDREWKRGSELWNHFFRHDYFRKRNLQINLKQNYADWIGKRRRFLDFKGCKREVCRNNTDVTLTNWPWVPFRGFLLPFCYSFSLSWLFPLCDLTLGMLVLSFSFCLDSAVCSLCWLWGSQVSLMHVTFSKFHWGQKLHSPFESQPAAFPH